MIQDHAYRPSIYTPEEIEQICKAMEQHISTLLKDVPSQTATKTAKVGIVAFGNVKEHLEKFKNISLDANKHLFGFDLYQITDLENLHYNIYDTDCEYSWHTDSIRGGCSDFKLTALLNVSTEPYEGGELELFFSSKAETITQFSTPGSFFIFPSWIPHRITPVTSGKRKSISMFFQGPMLK